MDTNEPALDFAALLDLEKTPAALPYDARGYDLDGFREWLAALGHPERGPAFVHIAGTKGKGSTAALAESILLGCGFGTATFTSPHLAHFGERYRYNGVPWTPTEFEAALARLNAASQPPWRDALKSPHRFRTAFEFMTMAALVEFHARHRQLLSQSPPRRQVVCWETGLGGRLDCTNVVDPRVVVVTALGLDHTAILGDTIEAIAAEKAGIIKPGRPVVVARQPDEFAARALPVLVARAAEVGATVWKAWEICPVRALDETLAGQSVEYRLPDGSRHRALLPLRGAFQRGNLEAALAAGWLAAKSLDDGVPLAHFGPRAAQGLAACRWPGRMDVRLALSGQALVLDGAHCPLSAAAASRALADWKAKSLLPVAGPTEVLWGMQRDKDQRAFLSALRTEDVRDLFGGVHSYRVTGVRGAEAEALAEVARELHWPARAYSSPQAALDAAAATGRNVLAIGTLYTLALLADEWDRHGASRSQA